MDGGNGAEDGPVGGQAHPSDRLPEFVRGEASDHGAVEAHLAACERCRREVELLRALTTPGPPLSPEARERAWRGFAAALPASGAGGTWLSPVWKVAAAAAVVVMGLGIWQANRHAAAGGGWDPATAMRAWEADLADLRPEPEEVRLALGFEAEGGAVPWEALEGPEPPEIEVPWEEGRR